MTSTDPARRVRLLTALLLVGTFAGGVLTGAGVVRWSSAPTPSAAAPALPPPLPAARLPRELALTPAQEAAAREIGERFRPELEALAKDLKPRVRAVQDRMEAEFHALLTAEQKEQLTAIEARRRHPPRPAEPPPAGAPRPADGPPAAGARPSPPAAAPGPAAKDRPEPGRRPPAQESIDACLHLDLDQLCRFTRNGREHEGSCRRGPSGTEPLHCAPDRWMEPR